LGDISIEEQSPAPKRRLFSLMLSLLLFLCGLAALGLSHGLGVGVLGSSEGVVIEESLWEGKRSRSEDGTFFWIPLFQHATRLDLSLQEGETSVHLLLADKLQARVQLQFSYRLRREALSRALSFARSSTLRHQKIRARLHQVLAEILSQLFMVDLISIDLEALQAEALRQARLLLHPQGVQLEALTLASPRLSKEFALELEQQRLLAAQVKALESSTSHHLSKAERLKESVDQARRGGYGAEQAKWEQALSEAQREAQRVRARGKRARLLQELRAKAEREVMLIRAQARREAALLLAEGLRARVQALEGGERLLDHRVVHRLLPQLEHLKQGPEK